METETKFYMVGNNLSLDFVNTKIAPHGEPIDLLENAKDFVDWAQTAGLLEKSQAAEIIKRWSRNTEANELKEVWEFRRVLREMFKDLTRKKTVKPKIIEKINEILRRQSSFFEIAAAENNFEKRFHADYREPRDLLAPIAESAADLLCYGNLDFVKKCENAPCMIYFYDTTKNHSRRWCSMAFCGNRAKAKLFYQRKKSAV